ncbi:hypothetical protein HN681_03830 [archaeon]|jgi:hypothetical protein|nr:hypothetical protein [archaeon]MBT3730426.1 hypothetical protein [archaeon]MBT4670409.1 hypothetical protein [archaeon]MBT5030126.1 hypothetical protein [archaeon]MBT5288183.1 hypothetical protein [archaeon]
MVKIYVAHSKKFDFKTELYSPLRESELNYEHDIILPHEYSDSLFSSKEFFRNECDLLVVEASYPSTGAGIEAGWADAYDVQILVMHKKGSKLQSSMASMGEIIEYNSLDDMVNKLSEVLGSFNTQEISRSELKKMRS